MRVRRPIRDGIPPGPWGALATGDALAQGILPGPEPLRQNLADDHDPGGARDVAGIEAPPADERDAEGAQVVLRHDAQARVHGFLGVDGRRLRDQAVGVSAGSQRDL